MTTYTEYMTKLNAARDQHNEIHNSIQQSVAQRLYLRTTEDRRVLTQWMLALVEHVIIQDLLDNTIAFLSTDERKFDKQLDFWVTWGIYEFRGLHLPIAHYDDEQFAKALSSVMALLVSLR